MTMADKKISVTVDADRITVTPDTLIMTSQDDVHWHGEGPRKFSIEFDDDPGFGKTLGHEKATRKQRPSKKGRFKYTVISDENVNLKLDPIIIVEEPKTGEDAGGG
jgi:hypothetical protein